jgi:transmembrane sensor
MKSEIASRINEQAGAWLARRDSDDWSDEDQQEFTRWLAESYRHRVAYLRLEHVWEESRRLKTLAAGRTAGEIPPPGTPTLSPFFEPPAKPAETAERTAPMAPEKRAPLRSGRNAFAALAASLLLVLGAGSLWWVASHSGSTYHTPVGGLESVPLSDGSRVTLNTDTVIQVAVTKTERSVRLEKGEAFFEVTKDPKRPFVVTAGAKQVVAVGTRFSVYRNGDAVRVVVEEGTVRMEDRLLPAGAIARASDAGVLVKQEPLPEAREALSWRSGVLVFRDVTLADAIAEFNRYNKRKVLIEDPAVASYRIAGTFRATNAEAFVRLLEQGYPLHVAEREDNWVLRAN